MIRILGESANVIALLNGRRRIGRVRGRRPMTSYRLSQELAKRCRRPARDLRGWRDPVKPVAGAGPDMQFDSNPRAREPRGVFDGLISKYLKLPDVDVRIR